MPRASSGRAYVWGDRSLIGEEIDCRQNGVDRLLANLFREHKERRKYAPETKKILAEQIKNRPQISSTPDRPVNADKDLRLLRSLVFEVYCISDDYVPKNHMDRKYQTAMRVLCFLAREKLKLFFREIGGALDGLTRDCVARNHHIIAEQIGGDEVLRGEIARIVTAFDKAVNDVDYIKDMGAA